MWRKINKKAGKPAVFFGEICTSLRQKILCIEIIFSITGLKKVIDQYVDSVTLADLVNNHEEKCGKLDL